MRNARRNLDAELGQHGRQALDRERRLGRLVTGAIEADDQAIADQLIGSHALDGRDLLEPAGLGLVAEQGGQHQGEQQEQANNFHSGHQL